jgi:hypothetical protein
MGPTRRSGRNTCLGGGCGGIIHFCVAALVVRSCLPRVITWADGESPCMTATSGVIVCDFTVRTAGVAQPVEHRFCKPRVVSSSLTASSAGNRDPACCVVGFAGLYGEAGDFGWIPKRPKGPDCKSGGTAFAGSNPAPPMSRPIGLDWVRIGGSMGETAGVTQW